MGILMGLDEISIGWGFREVHEVPGCYRRFEED